MHPAEFDYYRARSVAEAVRLLRKHKDARLLAGGHSLVPAMKLRLAAPAVLVDIGRIARLAGIRVSRRGVRIGALTTHAALSESPELARACPVLAEAAGEIGDVQVRERGTIGGALAHADPAADYPPVMLALEAVVTAQGARGTREIPAGRFFKGLFTTALRRDEVLTSIAVPRPGPGTGGCYLKQRHPASSYAIVGVAALVTLADGRLARARVVVGGATEAPVRARQVEAALLGQAPTAGNIAAAAARLDITPTLMDDYASAGYRAHLARVLARRALALAVERAAG